MIRLAVVVEGHTEKEFVTRVLGRHLQGGGVAATPILVGVGRSARGGDVTVDRVAGDMARLCWNFDFVTSLVDYYGFRGKGGRTVDELEALVEEQTRQRLSRHRDPRRIFPYVQRHEFESLLFSDVRAFSRLPDAPAGLQDSLQAIRSRFGTPEDINDGSGTAPSKRIAELMPRYRKVAAAANLVAAMGLDVIRSECPRFDNWVARLEALETASSSPPPR